ncbi:MAG: hypothetical protein K0R93_1011 [Anaerosolibacter sp.]|jgi:hypothetical protein|uniref:hypothetical protein n=1 Tax=Anaerosolibacter sp. TaxID=1872527 RepID=UPI0026181B15|nr:hypothetical protein [Anaerosolibacter sp.]MDF2546113.1 hypothetical protein [Anaerosolibacter sp.]
MARKKLTVRSYIVRDGKRELLTSLPEEEQKQIAQALQDKFMSALGYVPDDTEDKEDLPKAQYI